MAAMSLLCFVSGYFSGNFFVCVAAGVCILVLVVRWKLRQTKPVPQVEAPSVQSPVGAVTPQGSAGKKIKKKINKKRILDAANPKTAKALMDRMLEQGRSAILLRPEVIESLNAEQRQAALETLDNDMARVTGGKVWLCTPSKLEIENGAAERPAVETAEFLVDRCVVTNHEYQRFVDDGGYSNDEYWCETSSASKSEFVDKTGEAGPRFWTKGAFPKGEGHLPVVGICWFEANAYARWAGKRLPTGAEWVKAAAAPTATVGVASQQRKYPWGESVEASQANLWQSGIGRPVSVTDFADAAVHDIYQLIGNVWEWTEDDFAAWQTQTGWDSESTSLKSIRGGAFDTYLETQASLPEQSGEEPYSRRHNIGFRCVTEPDQLVLQD
jgi:iron(II)-dependent oxidoreductase